MEWKICAAFIEMVDPERDNAPDYFKIVAEPMSLREVKKRILEKRYRTVAEYRRDMNLIWENAKVYNNEDSHLGQVAKEAACWFTRKMNNFRETPEEAWTAKMQKVVRAFYDAITHPPADLIPSVPVALVEQPVEEEKADSLLFADD